MQHENLLPMLSLQESWELKSKRVCVCGIETEHLLLLLRQTAECETTDLVSAQVKCPK